MVDLRERTKWNSANWKIFKYKLNLFWWIKQRDKEICELENKSDEITVRNTKWQRYGKMSERGLDETLKVA